MTFSLNNYEPEDPRLAHVKLWEAAFLQEMKAFQRQTAGRFQVTFMAEVGFGVPGSVGRGPGTGLRWVPPLLSSPGLAHLGGRTTALLGLREPLGQRG